MAQKIGDEPIQLVKNVELHLDVPRLLAMLATSETHYKHAQAIQLFSNYLDALAKKSIEINNPELLNLMFKMKLIKTETIKPINEEDNFFNDI